MQNLVYSLDGDRVVSREAREEELEAARSEAAEILKKDKAGYAIRSCWVCNSAHAHFLAGGDDGFLFCCLMGCGRWYYQGVDITVND
jgi:hypothetical protein